jgi:hypothetical protein
MTTKTIERKKLTRIPAERIKARFQAATPLRLRSGGTLNAIGKFNAFANIET